MPNKGVVHLTEAEQKLLKKLTTIGKTAADKIKHGRVLLFADIN